MFLVNSRRSRFTAAGSRQRPFYRRYGAILPSSFTRVLPNAFGYSPSTPVSVCGTGRGIVRTGIFVATERGTSGLSRRPCGTGVTSTPIPVTAASPAFNRTLGCRNIHRLPIDYAVRPRLRSRLTLGGLPFPRNPCAFGGPASHRPYRYSFRHTHSTALHHPLPVWLQCGRRRSPTTGINSNPRLRRDA